MGMEFEQGRTGIDRMIACGMTRTNLYTIRGVRHVGRKRSLGVLKRRRVWEAGGPARALPVDG